MIMFYWNWY